MLHSKYWHYAFRVDWSPEDDEYVATCLEFPSLSWLDATPEDALAGLKDLIQGVIEDMRKNGEDIPEPLALREYSGSFNLRVGPQLHRQLVIRAKEQHQSLNQYIVQQLSHTLG